MQKILVIIASILVIFLGGYTVAMFNTDDGVSREIIIGNENNESEQQMDIKKVINNAEDQNAVDKIMMIHLNGKQITNADIDKDNPDLLIQVNSPKQSTGLIDSKIWFTNDGGIIGIRGGEGWEQINFLHIDKDNADYIKELVE